MSITIVGEKFNVKNGYNNCSRSHVVVKCNECESENFIIRYSDKHLIQSCGCAYKTRTHNLSSSSTYRIWRGMRSRCTNNKCKEYNRYGGRGITICERWNKFEMFLEDMGIRPEGLSLDRIDNNKGYCKENCRWATREEQNRNKRSNTFLTINNRTMTIAEWTQQEGSVSFGTIWARIQYGFTDHQEIVFSKPHSKKMKKKAKTSMSPAKNTPEGAKDVKEETKREETDGPQDLSKGQVVPQKRKGCCGGKACKATRPTPKGNEQ